MPLFFQNNYANDEHLVVRNYFCYLGGPCAIARGPTTSIIKNKKWALIGEFWRKSTLSEQSTTFENWISKLQLSMGEEGELELGTWKLSYEG